MSGWFGMYPHGAVAGRRKSEGEIMLKTGKSLEEKDAKADVKRGGIF